MEHVEKKREELDRKFQEIEHQDNIEKTVNSHLYDSVNQIVD